MIHRVELSERVQTLLSTYAKQTGQTEDEIIAEAIQNHLEELEDLQDAEAVLDRPGKRWTLEEVERSLDFAG
ncbi:MAG: CopG family transcriptional regulator [Cyanobacteria bacterium J06648_11]